MGNEYWAFSGIGKLYNELVNVTNPNALLPGYARIHYFRPDGNYSSWSVYAFADTAEYTGDYNDGLTFVTSTDSYGAYFDIKLIPSPHDLGFIVHNTSTGVKDPGPDMHLNVGTYTQAWVISGNATVFTTVPTPEEILASLLLVEQAYWLDRQRVAIQPQFAQSGDAYALSYSLTGGLSVTPTGITGGTNIPLTIGGSLTPDELLRYPQLSHYTVLQLPSNIQLSEIQTVLKGQLAFSAVDQTGALKYATGIQFAGVLDDLYYYPGRLGVIFHHDDDHGWRDWADDDNCAVKLKLWAPTSQGISLNLFSNASDTSPAAVIPMHNHNGVWVACGTPNWSDKYYLYSVKVWVPADSAVDTNLTTDPYSIDIAFNGTKSRITDLDSDETKPAGWDQNNSPPLRSLSDLSLYELHIRDFSVNDLTVPAAHRGFYVAFTDQNSDGMKHLRSLAQSGLAAVHILPSFHFASVNEDKSTWKFVTSPVPGCSGDLSSCPPDGTAAAGRRRRHPEQRWL
jgi:pullulanase